MKHHRHKFIAVALGRGLLLAAGNAGDATAPTATIKRGSFAPATSPSTVKAVKPWMRAVKKDSGGGLLRALWGPLVVPGDQSEDLSRAAGQKKFDTLQRIPADIRKGG